MNKDKIILVVYVVVALLLFIWGGSAIISYLTFDIIWCWLYCCMFCCPVVIVD